MESSMTDTIFCNYASDTINSISWGAVLQFSRLRVRTLPTTLPSKHHIYVWLSIYHSHNCFLCEHFTIILQYLCFVCTFAHARYKLSSSVLSLNLRYFSARDGCMSISVDRIAFLVPFFLFKRQRLRLSIKE